MERDYLFDHLRHAQEGFGFEAFGRADDDRLPRKMRQHGGIHAAGVGRGHYAKHDVGVMDGFTPVLGDLEIAWDFDTR